MWDKGNNQPQASPDTTPVSVRQTAVFEKSPLPSCPLECGRLACLQSAINIEGSQLEINEQGPMV